MATAQKGIKKYPIQTQTDHLLKKNLNKIHYSLKRFKMLPLIFIAPIIITLLAGGTIALSWDKIIMALKGKI